MQDRSPASYRQRFQSKKSSPIRLRSKRSGLRWALPLSAITTRVPQRGDVIRKKNKLIAWSRSSAASAGVKRRSAARWWLGHLSWPPDGWLARWTSTRNNDYYFPCIECPVLRLCPAMSAPPSPSRWLDCRSRRERAAADSSVERCGPYLPWPKERILDNQAKLFGRKPTRRCTAKRRWMIETSFCQLAPGINPPHAR